MHVRNNCNKTNTTNTIHLVQEEQTKLTCRKNHRKILCASVRRTYTRNLLAVNLYHFESQCFKKSSMKLFGKDRAHFNFKEESCCDHGRLLSTTICELSWNWGMHKNWVDNGTRREVESKHKSHQFLLCQFS